MTIEVLITTLHAPLGKMIRQVLEQNGYKAEVSLSAAEAVALCQQRPFNIAILDFDLPDQPVSMLGPRLKRLYPDLKLVIFPPENNPASPLLGEFTPDAFLNKPFYLPDLLSAISKLLAGNPYRSPHLPAPP